MSPVRPGEDPHRRRRFIVAYLCSILAHFTVALFLTLRFIVPSAGSAPEETYAVTARSSIVRNLVRPPDHSATPAAQPTVAATVAPVATVSSTQPTTAPTIVPPLVRTPIPRIAVRSRATRAAPRRPELAKIVSHGTPMPERIAKLAPLATPRAIEPSPPPSAIAATLPPAPVPVFATPLPTRAPTTTPQRPATYAPTQAPTVAVTFVPTAAATNAPTSRPTAEPTSRPTPAPTLAPTTAPTAATTAAPTAAPTAPPTAASTAAPTAAPTPRQTSAPTARLTAAPTERATVAPLATVAALSTAAPLRPKSVTTAQPGRSTTADSSARGGVAADRIARSAAGAVSPGTHARGSEHVTGNEHAATGHAAPAAPGARGASSAGSGAVASVGGSARERSRGGVPGVARGLDALNGRLNAALPGGSVAYATREYANDLSGAIAAAKEGYYKAAAPPPDVLARALYVIRQPGNVFGGARSSVLYVLHKRKILGFEICTGWKVENDGSGAIGGYTFGPCSGEEFTPSGGLPTLAPTSAPSAGAPASPLP